MDKMKVLPLYLQIVSFFANKFEASIEDDPRFIQINYATIMMIEIFLEFNQGMMRTNILS